MNLRERPPREIEVNVTPLIDVVFLLLIFFMVSTTFVRESAIELTLPEASEEQTSDSPDVIEVAISRDGTVYVNGRALSDSRNASLRESLAAVMQAGAEQTVVISADENATHQAVIDVMDAARQLGLYRVTFPTRTPED